MSAHEPRDEPDPRLVDLAMQMVDETAVDWESARQTAADLSETLEHLRRIESLATEHRRARVSAGRADRPVAFRWGGLQAIEPLGSGGFGEVWRAWDPTLERDVALKLRRGDLTSDGTTRWLREARRLARVRHPHVVVVYGADVHDGRPGLSTELVRGRTLEQRLRSEGPCGAAEAALIGVDLCAALAAVHAAGLVHGDVKLRNVMREGDAAPDGPATGAGRIVLMDFGSAAERALDDAGDGSGGTPLYAAPELLNGAAPSVASDLYALGVALFRLVSGRFPVDATSVAELRTKLAAGDGASLRTLRPDLPPAFVRAVEKALASEPRARYRDAGEMEHALAAAIGASLTRAGVARRRPVTLAAAALIGAALVATAWVLHARWPEWSYGLGRGAPGGHAVAVTERGLIAGHEFDGRFGWTVLSPGDLDGDGLPDLVVGAPGEDAGRGRVYVYRGRPGGLFEPWRTLTGADPGGGFGWAIAAGDLDGDGHPDLVVGANESSARARRAGSVSVFHGGPDLSGTPRTVIFGRHAGQDFGYALAVGDLTGDGHADLIVGAPGDASGGASAGRVYVYAGGAGLDTIPLVEMSSGVPDGQFGISLALPGDLDGEGHPDLAVGANWDASDGPQSGRVYVYSGGPSPRTSPSLVIPAPERGAWFGISLAGPGDLDGDGYPDLAVGAEFARGSGSNEGAVFVYRGGPHASSRPAFMLPGGPSVASYGGRLFAPGDLDGDGYPDLGVIGRWYGSGPLPTGLVDVYSGGPGFGGRPRTRRIESMPTGNAGPSATALPDLDGGGFRGLALGEATDTRVAPQAGAVRMLRLERYRFTSPTAETRVHTGDPIAVDWLGAEPARLEWSDDERTWHAIAVGTGGRERNAFEFRVPAEARGGLSFRLSPSDPKVRGETRSATVELIATPVTR